MGLRPSSNRVLASGVMGRDGGTAGIDSGLVSWWSLESCSHLGCLLRPTGDLSWPCFESGALHMHRCC